MASISHICLPHELTEGDFIRRINFLEWFICQFANPRFSTNLVVDDEAVFVLNGKVITWNVREYAPVRNLSQFNYDARSSR